jgi:hypothetical protein
MPVQLNHTIGLAKDNEAAARFYVEALGLTIAGRLGPFVGLRAALTAHFETSLSRC